MVPNGGPPWQWSPERFAATYPPEVLFSMPAGPAVDAGRFSHRRAPASVGVTAAFDALACGPTQDCVDAHAHRQMGGVNNRGLPGPQAVRPRRSRGDGLARSRRIQQRCVVESVLRFLNGQDARLRLQVVRMCGSCASHRAGDTAPAKLKLTRSIPRRRLGCADPRPSQEQLGLASLIRNRWG